MNVHLVKDTRADKPPIVGSVVASDDGTIVGTVLRVVALAGAIEVEVAGSTTTTPSTFRANLRGR